MKMYRSLLLLFVFGCSSLMMAQDIQGVATYKTQRKVSFTLDSTQFDDAMQERMTAMLRKQFERTYNLEFTESESVYKEEESLDSPGNSANSGGMMVVVAGMGGGNDVLYKNLKEGRYANRTEMFSKEFLIKDALEETEWTLTKETKNIGQYTCFKATTTRMVRQMSSVSSSDGSDESESTTDEEVEQTITAWYTPQIPVKNGPSQYGGLPGLILEVSDGSETILCSKIVLNPADGISIKEPTKGKKVNEEEYNAIIEKKMKEMNEQFQSDGRRGNGNRMEIRIGG